MTHNEAFEESTAENYVKRVGDAARDTTLPRGSLRIRGAEYRRPCRMIITAKESTGRERRERNSSREITGCPEVRGFPRNPISTTNKN